MMPQKLPTDETTILDTYSSRQDAEIAKAQLEEHEISCFIVADDVHPPLQLTEGVELRVLDDEAETARQVLAVGGDAAAETNRRRMAEPDGADEDGDLTFSQDGFVQATAWTYVAAFLLMVTVIIMGLLISSWGF